MSPQKACLGRQPPPPPAAPPPGNTMHARSTKEYTKLATRDYVQKAACTKPRERRVSSISTLHVGPDHTLTLTLTLTPKPNPDPLRGSRSTGASHAAPASCFGGGFPPEKRRAAERPALINKTPSLYTVFAQAGRSSTFGASRNKQDKPGVYIYLPGICLGLGTYIYINIYQVYISIYLICIYYRKPDIVADTKKKTKYSRVQRAIIITVGHS